MYSTNCLDSFTAIFGCDRQEFYVMASVPSWLTRTLVKRGVASVAGVIVVYLLCKQYQKKLRKKKWTQLLLTEPVVHQRDTSLEELDACIGRVCGNKDKWATLPAKDKLNMIRTMKQNLSVEAERLAITYCKILGYDYANPAHGHLVGEAYAMSAIITSMWLVQLEQLYDSLANTGQPPHSWGTPQEKGDGLLEVPVFGHQKAAGYLGLLADGALIKLQLKPDEAKTELKPDEAEQGVAAFNPTLLPAGARGILGPGNFAGPTDILHTLFLDNHVAVYKFNPVTQDLAPVMRRILAPLIDAGYLYLAVGGVQQGDKLAKDPRLNDLLLTGSNKTYDAIVFGPDQQKRQRLVKKPFMAELGSVNPWIIVPGKWSKEQIDLQAKALVAAKMSNSGHICASPQVLVTSKHWPQRQEFLTKVRELFCKFPGSRAYYPGSTQKYEHALQALCQELGASPDQLVCKQSPVPGLFNQLNPVFAVDVPASSSITREEAFAPVLAEIPMQESDPAAFLAAAAKLSNEQLWGNLSSTVIIDDATRATCNDAFDKFLVECKVGALVVNRWAINAAVWPVAMWGAYPCNRPEDIQSGCGVIGNSLCLKGTIHKTVIEAPFMGKNIPQVASSLAMREKVRLVNSRIHTLILEPTASSLISFLSAAILGM
eukprot:g46620.t1